MTAEIGVFTPEQELILDNLDTESNGFVNFSEICFKFLNEQTQYVSRHLIRDFEEVYLADDIRVIGEDEYELMIHRDDVRLFIARLRSVRLARGLPCK